MNNSRLQTSKYILLDILSASLAWTFFIYFRATEIENVRFIANQDYFTNLIIVIIGWFLLYFFSGAYKDIFRKSRLNEFVKTFFICLIGVTSLFFIALLDDSISDYRQYYLSFSSLFALHFSITSFFRFLLTNHTTKLIHNRELGFNTILLGSGNRAMEIFEDIENEKKSSGNKIIGFLNIFEKEEYPLSNSTPHIGNYHNIIEIIHQNKVEEIIIAIEKKEHYKIEEILNILDQTNVIIKVIPDMYDILLGRVKMNSILGTPLIEVKNDFQPEWEKRFKLFSDYIAALFCVIIFSPIFIICAIIVKTTSKGPIIFKQERLGINGQPFSIFKFRSMYLNSENNGPQLSSDRDQRITRFGKFMRKVRLDEIPQFFNILKGDMSFVGPRPERAFYADKLIEAAPHYKRIYKVKPGITSWGMVKFGYAQNLEEMLRRLKFDILYIENRSLLIDLKIMIHTIVIILERKGK